MKMKTKVSLTILPVVLVGIVAINVAFIMFFQGFVLESEDEKIRASTDYISTYINEQSNYYLGIVNDWGHWDDTYYFIENLNHKYIELNLADNSMEAIDVNFMIFLDQGKSIIHKKFYGFDNDESKFLKTYFLDNLNFITNLASGAEDTSGILKIGDNFYFVASSIVTDSLEKEGENGYLIIGKLIDEAVIRQMETSSGLILKEMNVVENTSVFNYRDPSNYIEIDYDNIKENSIGIKFLVPNKDDLNSSIVITLEMERDLYISGMKKALSFVYINTLSSVIVSIIIFLFLGYFITKPFTTLIDDVKGIDVDNLKTQKIPENGKDEFYFLRHSINSLLEKVVSSQNQLLESREELHATLLSIDEGIITVDNNGKIKFMNMVAEKITGFKLEEALDQPIDSVLFLNNMITGEKVKSPVGATLRRKQIIKISKDISFLSHDGELMEVEITAAPLKNQNQGVVGCVLAINDITDSRQKQRDIEYLSYRDILTGVYNRLFYEEKLKEYQTQKNSLASIIIIDANGLKLTNDAFGHEAGDNLLIKMAECIERSVRSEDIVCRIGGDEFVVLLPDADEKETMRINAKIHAVAEEEKIENIPISVSTGWATKDEEGTSINYVFKQAEDMMYHNKSSDNKSQRHQTIQIIMKTLFEKNPREEAHSKRVSELCYQIGVKMEMDSYRVKNLQTAGLLHDIGKIGIGNHYLDKEGSLTDQEWVEVKKHPQISHNILCSVNDYGPLAEIVLSHHERWDGKGYPSGLAGEQIPLESRIIAIADSFDAMISDRPYRKGMPEKKALEIILNESGKQFDPELVDVFLNKIIVNVKS